MAKVIFSIGSTTYPMYTSIDSEDLVLRTIHNEFECRLGIGNKFRDLGQTTQVYATVDDVLLAIKEINAKIATLDLTSY